MAKKGSKRNTTADRLDNRRFMSPDEQQASSTARAYELEVIDLL
jgi:hypothetical protein